MNVWQLGFRIVGVIASVGLVVLLLGVGVLLLVRRAGRNTPPR
jgi:hypothetical protein